MLTKNKTTNMADRISVKERSNNMSKIKSKNTRLELRLRSYLYKHGMRYRLNYPLFGKPDLVFPSKKAVVFINGCFWHQHSNCNLAYMPKSNISFWRNKLSKNTERDRTVLERLYKEGWKVFKVWECDIENRFEKTVSLLTKEINNYKKRWG